GAWRGGRRCGGRLRGGRDVGRIGGGRGIGGGGRRGDTHGFTIRNRGDTDPFRSAHVFHPRPSPCLLHAMQGLAVVLFQMALMIFALGMERLENRLRKLREPDTEVLRYLDRPSNSEVDELTEIGVPADVANTRNRGPAQGGIDVARAS